MDKNNASQGFSFKFSKTVLPPKVDKSKIQNDEDKVSQELEFVKSVEDKEIQSSKPKEEKTELIIPLITKNVWRLPKTEETSKTCDSNDQTLSLDQQALREIIEDTKRRNEEIDSSRSQDPSLIVPLLMQNQVPEGFETDDKLDVRLRPDPSNLDDYEKVPIEHFGLAALKGMGWKPGDGIGKTNKKFVAPVEVTVRPRGLGLGANMKDLDALKNKAASQEEFPFIVGAYVCVVEGNSKGMYGQIQSLDDETGRVVVKISDSDKLVTLPEIFLKAVSVKEFKKQGKTLNRDSFEEYTRQAEDGSDTHPSKKSKKRKHKERSHSRSPSSERLKKSEHKKKKRNKDRYRERSETPPLPTLWIHPQLKMRIIDQKYKKGKYFNTKVVIEDVVTPTSCVCRTDDGKLLEDIESRMLETVIPRTEPGYVMVLQGQYRGKVGVILNRDKAKCVATMHLLPDNQTIIKISYDSICEFVGDISIYE